ncbi:MAG: ribosomal protein modification protein RimK [Bacteroidota bacterium]|jgi:hypothetical protein|nr:ribosomal protein modification protein RimK [Bacteroidota bacterium]
MQREKQIIGRREVIAFPELGLYEITAKIDTGAYTTALHCHDIREEKGELYFKLLDPSHPYYNSKEYKFSDFRQKEIKNSFGEVEKRYIIKTHIKIGRKRINSVISLTDRGNMRYPVLIGRKLLKNRYIVDVALLNNIPPSIRKKRKS